MPRKPRFNLIGVPQHVIQRGNNREPCFFAEADYRRYLEDLTIASKKYGCRIHAYVLMTNYVHLLITPMMDHAYHRTGTLCEGRYKSSLIDSDHYLFTCMRYIELNPVRASMVDHPGEYQWSSYGVNAQGMDNGLVEPHPLYHELGSEPVDRLTAYRELFRHHIDNDTLHEIRDSLNHELVLGRSYFKDRIELLTNRQTKPGKPGRPKVEEVSAEYVVHY